MILLFRDPIKVGSYINSKFNNTNLLIIVQDDLGNYLNKILRNLIFFL